MVFVLSRYKSINKVFAIIYSSFLSKWAGFKQFKTKYTYGCSPCEARVLYTIAFVILMCYHNFIVFNTPKIGQCPTT